LSIRSEQRSGLEIGADARNLSLARSRGRRQLPTTRRRLDRHERTLPNPLLTWDFVRAPQPFRRYAAACY